MTPEQLKKLKEKRRVVALAYYHKRKNDPKYRKKWRAARLRREEALYNTQYEKVKEHFPHMTDEQIRSILKPKRPKR